MVNRDLRIIFMGTPEFAIPSLQFLVDAGYKIISVITAPDKPGGRGMKEMISSPVKQFAVKHNIPVLQPDNLKARGFIQALAALQADLQVVVAFRMLPEIVWKMPALGTINLHGSLLPAYRGAAPIQWAVINGDHITGVTTFRLQREIDTGEILLQREIPILEQDTAGTLHDRMMLIGAGVLLATVDLLNTGMAKTRKQDPLLISHAPKIHHETAKIDWTKPSREIHNLIRGMAPFPGAWTRLDGMELKIYRSMLSDKPGDRNPGQISVRGKDLIVQTGTGELILEEIQLSGKRKMSARDFINGYKIKDSLLT